MATPFNAVMEQLPNSLKEALLAHLPQPFVGHIPVTVLAKIENDSGLQGHELLLAMLPLAASFAITPISHFDVGVIVRGLSGDLYFGSNLELDSTSLFHTVHGEQSAISHAWLCGEQGLSELVVNYSPCGHCRQFMNELNGAEQLTLVMPGQENAALPHYLPYAFGPKDLNVEVGLMAAEPIELQLNADDALVEQALIQAKHSYAPYSHSPAGIALECHDGQVFVGRYAENAAFNPSMQALQMALTVMARHRIGFEQIARAVLVEREDGQISHLAATQAALTALGVKQFTVHYAR